MDPDTNAPLCPDWVVVNTSNVHVAKDRGWFKTYTPFKSTVDASPQYFSDRNYIPVLGIGSVEIQTTRSPDASGASSHGTLVLHEVLHAPDAICNLLGSPLVFDDGYTVAWGTGGPKSYGSIKDSQGEDVAYLDTEHPKWTPKVRCPPDGYTLGQYVLKKDKSAWLGCHWDEAEERRWQEFKAQQEQPTSGRQPRDHLLLPQPAFPHKKKRRAPQRRQSAHRQDATSHKAKETAPSNKTYALEFLILIIGISVAWWTMSGVRA